MTRTKQKVGDGIRIITKYPNRRLYDRDDSQYIPFAGLKKLIKEGIEFKVIDDKTGEDVTRFVLTQVIAEMSLEHNQFLSEKLLRQIIKFYGHPMGNVMGLFLEKAMKDFLSIQKKSQSLIFSGFNSELNELSESIFKKNQEYLKEVQKLFFKDDF